MEDEELDEGVDAGLLGETDDYAEPSAPALGGLSGLGVPGAEGALALLVKSNEQARAALQQAREKIAARKYSKAIPLLAISGALGQPTRSGSSAEGWANAANALIAPLREREQFEVGRDKELLGIDTQLAGLDQNAATAQLQLAQLRARLMAEAAKAPVEKVVEGDDVIFRGRQDAIGKKAWVPPAAQTTIDMKGETEAEKVVGKGIGEDFLNIQRAAAIESPRLIDKLDRMEFLMQDIGGGAAAPLLATVASVAQSFGLKIDPKLGPKQAAEALAKEMALILRNPSEGAGMPGNLSNQDREYLKSMVPGLSQSAEGRKLIIETARKLAQRTQELGKIAREFKRNNKGRLDEGLYEVLQTYADEHPLFPKETDEEGGAGAQPTPEPAASAPREQAAAPAAQEAPYGFAPSSWAIDPGARVPRAPPQAEAALKANPALGEQFIEKYGYIPL